MLDSELNLSVQGMSKSLPIRVILFWVGSIIALFWAASQTFVSRASPWLIILFAIIWISLTAFFGKQGKTKEMNFQRVPTLFGYFQPGARKIITRRGSDPSGFYSLVNIDDIDESGLIQWSDGTIGQAYSVAGSASILLFESDKIAILDRVDKFFRKIDVGPEFIWITTKSPKKIWVQLANLEKTNLNLKNRDPELIELLNEQFDILKDYVGGAFPSVHQYLIVKASNLEELRKAASLLVSESRDSSLMFKQITMMDADDTIALMRIAYGVDEV